MEKLEHILHSQKALDEFENCDNQTLRNISLNISHYCTYSCWLNFIRTG